MFEGYRLVVFMIIAKGVFGVDGDEVKSVMEGDSVTLNADITQIQTDDNIEWLFESQTLIAEIKYGSIYDAYDERFRDRLKLDSQTGSLTITNIRITHTGLYRLKISSIRGTSYKRFNVTVNRVFGDEVKSMSVIEGDSLTLHTDITQIQTDDQILWMFVSQDTSETLHVAEFVEKKMIIYDDDERFRNNLQLDNHTGSLTIRNVSSRHTGVYKVNISRKTPSNKTFYVTVYVFHTESFTWLYLMIVGLVVLLLAIYIIVVVWCCKKKIKRAREAQNPPAETRLSLIPDVDGSRSQIQ